VERRELLEALPAGMVFLHGGGNFGDVWPHYQAFREDVMGLLPGRPLVQMPQSLHFADPAGVDRAAAAIADHGAFTLLVRDTASLDLARERFGCPVHLCPDMAFAIGEIARPRPPDLDVLLLLRTDKEAAVDRGATLGKLPAGWQVADWLEDAANHNRRALWGARLAVLRTGDPAAALPRNRSLTYFRLLAEGRVERGIEMLSRARFVVTDRLHGHILCTLCGIPHAFLDNTYGKITRFASTFGTVWSGVTRAGSLEEGIAAAQAHLGRGPERNGTKGP
jgi:pyruvyl transferase EpsO